MPYDYTFNEVENAFISWLVEIGLPPANTARLKLDGEKHRYRSAREKRVTQEPVEYKVYMDESPAGYVQDYKTGAYYSWSYHRKNEKPWTEDEKRAYLRKREERKEESEREAAIARARAIADAGKKWEMATPVDPKALHPYLKKKRLSRAYGARILGRNLIIPLYNKEGEIVSVQEIGPDGTKRFQRGAPKQGCFFILGDDIFRFFNEAGEAEPPQGERARREQGGREVFVCEGFATGATIHEVTGRTVVVAWDCGNMKRVVENVRPRFPGCLALAPDVDKTPGNPGMAAAFEIAEAFGIPFTFPPFAEGDQGTDWNDYCAIYDVERTAEAIFQQLEESRKIPDIAEYCAWPRWIGRRNENGDPKNTKENLEILLAFKKINIRYDEVKKELSYEFPPGMGGGYSRDNKQNSNLSLIISTCENFNFPTTAHLRRYLALIADERRFNPVRDWIVSKSWDGLDRIGQLCDTLSLMNWYPEDMKRLLIRKWLISAVAASGSEEGFQARGVLVLQGRQTMGKTSWLRNLMPFNCGWFLEGVTLNPEDKDSLKKTASHWIVELGELDATFKKSDISKLKGFITSMTDLVRLPFAAEFSDFPRRTVFCATVNQQEFLIDTTGNSRWWVLPCVNINFQHGLDLQQLWAQTYRLFCGGGEWWLTDEENARLDDLNRNFEASDEVEDLLGSKWNWERYEELFETGLVEWKNATTALKACGMLNPTKAQVRRAGEILRGLTGRDPQRRGKAGDRCYLMPSETFY